jgi:hypothetical protein
MDVSDQQRPPRQILLEILRPTYKEKSKHRLGDLPPAAFAVCFLFFFLCFGKYPPCVCFNRSHWGGGKTSQDLAALGLSYELRP